MGTMKNIQMTKIVLLLIFSCFLTTPLLASDPVTVAVYVKQVVAFFKKNILLYPRKTPS